MAFKNLFRTSLVICLLVASFELGAMMRPLHGEQWLEKDNELSFQSLQKGPVTGSGHNPCTEIPGRETGVCKLGGMNVAGYVTHTPPAFPVVVTEFGVASIAKGTA
ncbi:transcription factor bHLH3-like [Hibiscus syriacus]|uniref:Transcription factor bHLH3-like n=1 Tax=Hibiscus syriacus TaxID=106335 RepID=A0A6A2Y7L7_HIBSY|nr:transcription factor bHLH3-like [Hibiscus syriacus]